VVISDFGLLLSGMLISSVAMARVFIKLSPNYQLVATRGRLLE